MVRPPLTGSVWPVMNPAPSEAKKATAAATSAGWPGRFIGTARAIAAITFAPGSSSPTIPVKSGVSVGPGQTTLQVTPPVAGSRASDFVKPG